MFNGQVFTFRGRLIRTLRTGTYVVFERRGFHVPGDGGSLSIEQVTVTDEDGTKLPLSYSGFTQTLDQDAAVLRGAVEFTVRNPGTYTIGANSTGAGQFTVAASLVGTCVRISA